MEAVNEIFDNEVTYTGSITDTSTGLQYMNARDYDNTTGRFLTQDTYTGNAYEPWTQHLYSYCGNNPTNFIDPTGHRRDEGFGDFHYTGPYKTSNVVSKPRTIEYPWLGLTLTIDDGTSTMKPSSSSANSSTSGGDKTGGGSSNGGSTNVPATDELLEIVLNKSGNSPDVQEAVAAAREENAVVTITRSDVYTLNYDEASAQNQREANFQSTLIGVVFFLGAWLATGHPIPAAIITTVALLSPAFTPITGAPVPGGYVDFEIAISTDHAAYTIGGTYGPDQVDETVTDDPYDLNNPLTGIYVRKYA